MSTEAWDRYCAALEEMRRHREESTKWRRKLSARIEESAKATGVLGRVVGPLESLGRANAAEDDDGRSGTEVPHPGTKLGTNHGGA